MSEGSRTVDPQTIAKHFDADAAQARWSTAWEAQGIYHYDPNRSRDETFVVDTPPPTVSGSLHVGHVFSYTHTDVIVRQRRMKGLNIFYPMGWDDNGLPTERRVQNHFHVRCDPSLPYQAGLAIEPASAKDKKKPPQLVSRPNFIELCERLTAEDEKAFMALWQRLGLSVDWHQEYATINAHCRRTAQSSFLDLHTKGQLYNVTAPTLWDVDFQTAVAQAELDDRELESHFNDIAFGVEGSDEEFIIATTRPELLPACVGVTAHPDDPRYRHLFGKRAVTPLFGVPVPIFPSDAVDPEKGTGILMTCTFGDQTDVQWWREHGLNLRQVIGRNGRLVPVSFGTDGWESLAPEEANAVYAELAGKRPEQARARILELLGERPEGRPALRKQKPIVHAVKFYEKGDRPLEFVPTRQWFCRLLDRKADLLAKGEAVRWHPEHMGQRFALWTENLQFDWCISRQRYFGVPFPVWYPVTAQGEPNYEAPILAEPERLPVDPTTDLPTGFTAEQRGVPGGFIGETDVFDTWFTSSLSPQISSHWVSDPARHERLFPADLRPQAHEIIRTWAFYTIAKALAHEDSVPWHHVVISGWVVQRSTQGKNEKISKSKGGTSTGAEKGKIPPPADLIASFTADGVRYWSASARLGVDTAFDEKMLSIGKRLVTKLFNASKFVLSQDAAPGPIVRELDCAFVSQLRALVEQTTRSFDQFEFAPALKDTEAFFWANFTDSYIELAKTRARADDDAEGRSSAVAALRLGLHVLLRLFAPVLPYITEEVWSWVFAAETGHPSIHRAPWPSELDFEGIPAPEHARSFHLAVETLAAINRAKTAAGTGVGRNVEVLDLRCHPTDSEALRAVLGDIQSAARVDAFTLLEDERIPVGAGQVGDIRFAPKPAATSD